MSDQSASADGPAASDRIAPAAQVAQAERPAGQAPGLGARLLGLIGSMKLSVVLLILLAALTWLGTLAQIKHGLWQTQRDYFESWFVLAELPLSWWGEPLFPDANGEPWALVIPLPGAYPVMALLFLNLLVGGMLRMRLHARNVGILIIHVGIALLLIAGFVKLEVSYSGSLALYETPEAGQGVAHRQYRASTFVSFHDHELAVSKPTGDTIEERVVPEAYLRRAKTDRVVVSGDGLPFRVEVHHWLDNCRAMPKGPMVKATTPVLGAGDGPGLFLSPVDVQLEREHNQVGCYVTIVTADDQRLEAMLVSSPWRLPQDDTRTPFVFEVQGQRYGLDLRRVVYDMPFALQLDQFIRREHPGTMQVADFRSKVTVFEDGAQRQAQIWMNNPLRKGGFALYQTSWGPQIQGRPAGGPPWYSVFEVADNPSDKWPEYACYVIAIGMIVHFGAKLIRFLMSSTREALSA
ncbi:MAG: cytochrome c biogenesis protein ResB [Planctomycetes bacterium]|nr:cytochrome c biogenesis protein ResB [Planctomycetota bacterium]